MNIIHQVFHALCKILHGMLRRHPNGALAYQGLKQHVQVSHPIPAMLVIDPRPSYRSSRQTGSSFANQSSPPFIKANQWPSRIIGLLIQVQHILHAGHIVCTGLKDAPHLLLPGLQLVFLSVQRTVSCEIASTTCNCTNLLASSRKVQRLCPSGASVQAVAINMASARPSRLRFWPGRGSSFRALSMQTATKRLRIRSTHGRLTFKAAMICG